VSELIIAAFEDRLAAEEVRTKLLRMQDEHLLDLEDAVVVERGDDGKPKIRQLHNLTAAGVVGGGFWGTLIGLLLLHPLVGLVAGGTIGAISGALADVGIEDDFMREVGRKLRPGTSALCVLVRKATPDKVLERLRGLDAVILQTSLSHEDENRLRSVFKTRQDQKPREREAEHD
jgi:uncharacterized membrane protein